MQIEYEATFPDIDKNEFRKKLKSVGANLVKKEFLQKRVAFNLPKGHEIEGGWARIRDEGDRITLSLKIISGDKIHDQKEIFLEVDNFKNAEMLLKNLGCKKKAYQETKRELWGLNGIQITIDEWPFLEPFVEVEGKSEEKVRKISELLGFNFSEAMFGSVDMLYKRKYGVSEDVINNKTLRIVFGEENPFLRKE